MKPPTHIVTSPKSPKRRLVSRTKELCNLIDKAYNEGNINEALKIATKLVEMRVKSKIGDFNNCDQEKVVEACLFAAFDGRVKGKNFEGKFKGENKDKIPATFSTWLYGIVDNQIHSAIRERQRERSKLPDDRVARIQNYSFRSDGDRDLALQVSSLIEQDLTYKEMAKELNTTHALPKKTDHVALRKRVSRWMAVAT
jgi:hypothetical protein